MKRITALLLCVVLFYVLTVPIYAAEPETYSLRVSEYCEAASMSDYREQAWMTNVPLYAVSTYFQGV